MDIQILDAARHDECLEAAVERMKAKAVEDGRNGVLVTRHAPGRYTVEVSAEVPFGFTYEASV
ncbi:hypothetical protein [Arthrobacter sp. H14]|uniref:hypothetical protein n=1 Tax=Arthrobacter sp. H14 TaxID=1312959 RepID=UPI0006871E16|nr:hypothetical protein [Arthrobacter sp. H14]